MTPTNHVQRGCLVTSGRCPVLLMRSGILRKGFPAQWQTSNFRQPVCKGKYLFLSLRLYMGLPQLVIIEILHHTEVHHPAHYVDRYSNVQIALTQLFILRQFGQFSVHTLVCHSSHTLHPLYIVLWATASYN